MHFMIISVNRDSADLFIGDKSALAQMSCVDTQARARIDTHTHPICYASTVQHSGRQRCTQKPARHLPLCVFMLVFVVCCTLLFDFIVYVR